MANGSPVEVGKKFKMMHHIIIIIIRKGSMDTLNNKNMIEIVEESGRILLIINTYDKKKKIL